jgi:thioester reductase-like protein
LPIGAPIANTRAYVLDAKLEPAPVGAPGELYVSGVGLARGYMNRPALTAERFVPDPFGSQPGSRMYRTGDVARWLGDGSLEYMGRTDHQVKVRGVRIELGEVEAALASHPLVRQCAVVVRADASGDRRLVAYAALGGAADVPVAQLRGYLQDRLPGYMVPSTFVTLDALPLTPSGKVDRQALPVTSGAHQGSDRAFVAARTALEEALASAWAEVLGAERIGIHDNFFEVGGHSLLAARLATRLAQATGAELPLRALFETPTAAGVARFLGEHFPDLVTERFGVESLPQGEWAPTPIDLEAEVVLDSVIRAPGISLASVMQPRRVFLTGATGFLGAFLLRDLLEQTGADVCCLARAADSDAAVRRVRKGMESYGLWRDAYRGRIHPVVGDLAQPLLGMTRQRFEQLAGETDVIFHNGAQVHFLLPYHALRAANVGGTHEVLRLAALRRIKPVHYVSTIGVFPPRPGAADATEQDTPSAQGLAGGYNQSKWVAERLVALAGRRGLPVTIHRPGRVAWDSRTGAANPDDLLTTLVPLLIASGAYPRLNEATAYTDVTPVDFVSAAIVRLSLVPDSVGRAFHLINPNPADLRSLLEALRDFGYPLEEAAAEQWQAELAARALDSAGGAALSALLAGAASPAGELAAGIDGRRTASELAAAGLTCPQVNAASMSRFLTYGVRAGLFPAPPALVPETLEGAR